MFYGILTGKDILINNVKILDLENYKGDIGRFILYNFSLSIISFFLGLFFNYLLYKTQFKFHENYSFLDHTGYWDRILHTDILRQIKKENENSNNKIKEYLDDINGGKLTPEDIEKSKLLIKGYEDKIKNNKLSLYLSILCDVSGKLYIYEGVFYKHYIDKRGFIDKIVLMNAKRISIDDYDSKKDGYINLKNQNHLIIYGSTIVNICVTRDGF
ncbi:hypothetical protein [Tenacibaculum agarivorans]|uniref:hypothetical protein n=1 Tax=Tenacibaculum agarivorans TaxID=1908389 RepID=UPI00117F85F6|nr:hypothetical protein [Tenacibaculum agarivorans]